MSNSDKNNPSENEIEPPVDGPIPDWMRMATSSSSSPSLSDENTPDWLKAIKSGKTVSEETPEEKAEPEEDPYAGMSDLERLLAEEGIDLESVAEERPAEAAGMSVRDWMISTSEDEMIRKRVGAEPAAEAPELAVASAPEAEEEDPYAGMSDLERLLAEEGIDLGSVAEERPAEATGMSVRDWMISTSEDEMIRKRVGAELAAEAPELEAVQAEEDDMMVVEEDLPDWLRDVEEEPVAEPVATAYADIRVDEEELPDWLRDEGEEPAAAEFGPEEELLGWLRDVEEDEAAELEPFAAAVEENDKMVVEEDLPDWLRDVEEEEAASLAPAAAAASDSMVMEEDLPDWLRDVEEEPAVAAVAGPVTAAEEEDLVVEEELPDWLRDVEESEAEPAMALAETDLEDEEEFSLETEGGLPDWLKEVQAEADEERAAASAPVATAGTSLDFSDEDLPDWLREVQEEEAETEVAAGKRPETELPGWLRDVQEDEETFVEETVAVEDELVVAEELPDWLSEVQPEVEDDVFEPSEPSPEEPARVIDEELPDWLRGVEEEEELPVEALAEIETETAAEEELISPQPLVVEPEEPVSIIEESELPDWLREVEEEEAIAVPDTEAVDVLHADGEITRELPDWLEGVEAIEEAGEEVTPEPVAASAETMADLEEEIVEAAAPEPEPEPEPVPVVPVSRVTPPPPQPVVTPSSGGMPDWLKKLREGYEEIPAAATPPSQPVSVPQPVIATVVPQPEPVVASTITPARLPADADKLLAMARDARSKGNIGELAPIYDSLVASGAHLDSVIEDMKLSIKTNPTNYVLYQIMGDAMMRDGRLQSALDAYRQALTALSK